MTSASEYPGVQLVARDVGVEALYPMLHMYQTEVPNRPSTQARRDIKERLGLLAERIDGPRVLRHHEGVIPHAYRVLFQQMGIDVDQHPTPSDALMRERIAYGSFRASSVVQDALKVVILETSVAVWAIDSAAIVDGLVLRTPSGDADASRSAPVVPLLSDGDELVAPVGSAPQAPYAVRRKTKDLRLVALQCDGVPAMHVEEALWLASSLLHHR